MFIAVVTILSAVLLVMIGLTRTTTEDSKMTIHKKIKEFIKGNKTKVAKPEIATEPSLLPKKKPILKFKKRR